MNTMRTRIISFTVAFTMAFTTLSFVIGSINAYAASSKPGQVLKVELSTADRTATISWSKVKKNVSGYTIYRNGKLIKNVGKAVSTYDDEGLKPNKTYKYYVKAYNKVKQTQWYNKKTKKWENKKPPKKYRGKSRKVNKKLYGKASGTVKCRIKSNLSEDVVSGNYGYVLDKTIKSDSITFKARDIEGADTSLKLYRGGKLLATLNNDKNSFTDSGLKPSTKYTYTLKVMAGGKVRDTKTYNIKTTSLEKVKLSWNAFENTDKIEIYRDNVYVDTISGTKTSYEYENNDSKNYKCHYLKLYRAGAGEPYETITIEKEGA